MNDFEYRLIAVPCLDRSLANPVKALAIKVQRVIDRAQRDGWKFQQLERVRSAEPGSDDTRPNVLVFRRPRHHHRSKPLLVLDQPVTPGRAVAETALNPVRKPTIEVAVHGARGDFSARASDPAAPGHGKVQLA